MNNVIEKALNGFAVNGIDIPVKYMYYKGSADTYATYYETDADGEFYGDDTLLNYVSYYDFNVYSKGNYKPVIEALKSVLIGIGFTWCVSRDSPDMYEEDTKLYHKTICFAIERSENNG